MQTVDVAKIWLLNLIEQGLFSLDGNVNLVILDPGQEGGWVYKIPWEYLGIDAPALHRLRGQFMDRNEAVLAKCKSKLKTALDRKPSRVRVSQGVLHAHILDKKEGATKAEKNAAAVTAQELMFTSEGMVVFDGMNPENWAYRKSKKSDTVEEYCLIDAGEAYSVLDVAWCMTIGSSDATYETMITYIKSMAVVSSYRHCPDSSSRDLSSSVFYLLPFVVMLHAVNYDLEQLDPSNNESLINMGMRTALSEGMTTFAEIIFRATPDLSARLSWDDCSYEDKASMIYDQISPELLVFMARSCEDPAMKKKFIDALYSKGYEELSTLPVIDLVTLDKDCEDPAMKKKFIDALYSKGYEELSTLPVSDLVALAKGCTCSNEYEAGLMPKGGGDIISFIERVDDHKEQFVIDRRNMILSALCAKYSNLENNIDHWTDLASLAANYKHSDKESMELILLTLGEHFDCWIERIESLIEQPRVFKQLIAAISLVQDNGKLINRLDLLKTIKNNDKYKAVCIQRTSSLDSSTFFWSAGYALGSATWNAFIKKITKLESSQVPGVGCS